MIHAARLHKSARLQRALALLMDYQEHSTLELVQRAGVCAVNSIISELRANGIAIRCKRRGKAYFYRVGNAPMTDAH